MRGTRLRLPACGLALLAIAVVTAGCGDDDQGPGGLDLLKEGTLTVATDVPYMPFEGGDPPDYRGFDVDLINEVAARLGLEAKIVDIPFDIILQGGRGRFDLAIAATTITGERERTVDFSDPYFLSEQSLLAPKDGDVRSVEDLAGKVVGAGDDTTGERYAQESTDAEEVRPFAEIDDAFSALAAGQVDGVLNDLFSNRAAEKQFDELEVMQVLETGEEYGIVLPEGSDALREAVNEALVEIKEDGTLDELYREWLDKEAPEEVLESTHEAT